jgi:hypothetical protein
MAHSPLLGLDEDSQPVRPGHGTGALGPSDTSDSASDIAGVDVDGSLHGMTADTDSTGTGELLGASDGQHVREAGDILPDHIATTPDLAPPPPEPDLFDTDTDADEEEQEVAQARQRLMGQQPDAQ